MDKLNERILYASLFDIYGTLLTDKQQEIFKYYYNDDLSLNEIAEIVDMSRQAVHLHQQNAVKALSRFEEHLNILMKKKRLVQLLDMLEENLAWHNIAEKDENTILADIIMMMRKEV